MLLAAADRSDPDHTACRELLETHPGPLVTTELVIAETGWLIDRQLGAAAEDALYESAAAGEIRVEPLSAADWTRIAALTVQYADQHLGGVDSSLVAIAERLGASYRHTGQTPFRHRPSSAHRRIRAASVTHRHCPDCILRWPARACSPRVWTSPAAPLQQSHDPDYPHPIP